MSAGGNVCPFSFLRRFSRLTLLLATVSTKDHQYLPRENKTKKEGCDCGWLVWIVRGPKLPPYPTSQVQSLLSAVKAKCNYY